VLGLKALDPPDAPVEARARGEAIHAAFERYAAEHPQADDQGRARFQALVLEALEAKGMPQPRMARERALAQRLSGWATAFELDRRGGARLLVEQEGELALEAPHGPFTVTAKADRLELRGDRVDVLDFKTGAPPSQKQVRSGFAPQLTLTAALLRRGGFVEAGEAEPGQLAYVRITSRGEGELTVRAEPGESADLGEQALAGLVAHVARFDREETPYLSWAAPQFMGTYGGDYDHLARVWEWRVMGEGGDEG
jgi:ATP-dependent helicase/nuclease subunit B